MATRPAWTLMPNNRVKKMDFSFEFNPGFSITQKQKNVNALHKSIGSKTLEISTKSFDTLGKKLSAFNLKLNGYPLESIFQAGKVYEKGGPYLDLLNVSPKDAKRDSRHRESGSIISFYYNGINFPINPKTIFYDYIYCNSVKESISEDEIKEILDYEFFTDIEFVPSKSVNCQARSITIIKAMLRMFNEIPDISNFEDFLKFHKMLGVELA